MAQGLGLHAHVHKVDSQMHQNAKNSYNNDQYKTILPMIVQIHFLILIPHSPGATTRGDLRSKRLAIWWQVIHALHLIGWPCEDNLVALGND